MVYLPFSHKIMEESMPHYLKAPTMEDYNGTSDPFDHLESFRSLMLLQGVLDSLMCKALLLPSRKW